MKSKKKMTTTALAVALAVLLLIGGGTFAYLQSTTGDVKNNFNANKVMVDLKETTGNDYDIIPGTSQAKDPKVTVDNTVDAYVFVEVTDTTQGLVEYTIADGWTQLEGYPNVYYREVAKDADVKEFSVLAGDKVSYSTALENSDMVDADGNLKDGVELTFKAQAIQKAGFDSALAAYKQIPTEVTTTEELTAALENEKAVTLKADNTVSVGTITDKNVSVDLNNKTLTVTGGDETQKIYAKQSVTFENGTVKFENGTDPTAAGISLNGNDSELNLKNVTVETKNSILVANGVDSATINITDSTITTNAYYVVNTNAADPKTGKDVEINIKNSELTTSRDDGDNAGILFNIPGTLNIEKSTITADRQAVIVRCGTATIKDSTLACTAKESSLWAKYDEKNWGSGNEVPVAALVVGNRSASAYAHNASCTLSNTTLTLGDGNTGRKLVYAAACNGFATTVNGIDENDATIYQGDGSKVTIK